MTLNHHSSAILNAVVGLAQTWTTPQAPLDVRDDAGCLVGPTDARAAAAALQQRFADHALIDSGVCTEGDDGPLLLAPQLTADAGPLIALRCEAGAAPFAIMTGSRITPSAHDSVSILHDFTTRALLKAAGAELLLVPGNQVPLLRLWGVPCAALGDAAGELNGPYGQRLAHVATQLAETLGRGFYNDYSNAPDGSVSIVSKAPRRAGKELKDLYEPTLVLAGWTPEYEQGQVSALRDSLDFFLDLKGTQPDLPLRVGVWLPTERHQAALRAAWQLRNALGFRRQLGLSIATELYTPARALALGLVPPPTPPSMIEARDTLERAGKFFVEDPHLMAPYPEEYLAAMKREVTAPMLESARKGDPLQLALATAAVDETTGILTDSFAYQLELSACIADYGRDRAQLEALTKRRRHSAEQLMKLAKFQRHL